MSEYIIIEKTYDTLTIKRYKPALNESEVIFQCVFHGSYIERDAQWGSVYKYLTKYAYGGDITSEWKWEDMFDEFAFYDSVDDPTDSCPRYNLQFYNEYPQILVDKLEKLNGYIELKEVKYDSGKGIAIGEVRE